MAPSTGTLSTYGASEAVLRTGSDHLTEGALVTVIQNIHGALLLSSAGLLSIILGAGFTGAQMHDNPGVQRLLQGLAFPFGLVLVYLVGAELYTGYPMWYTMTALERKGRPLQYIQSALASWIGNLLGALIFGCLFTLAMDIKQEPWRSSLIQQITEDIVDRPWYIIFVRSIGCGWLVTIAMFLGTQNQDGISKALCLHFPFMISTTARLPHTVEYMYLSSAAMTLGAPLSVGGYIWKCLLPLTLGNTIGGAGITGLYLWWVHICSEKHHGEGNVLLEDDG